MHYISVEILEVRMHYISRTREYLTALKASPNNNAAVS
jgi:hypothetical protein